MDAFPTASDGARTLAHLALGRQALDVFHRPLCRAPFPGSHGHASIGVDRTWRLVRLTVASAAILLGFRYTVFRVTTGVLLRRVRIGGVHEAIPVTIFGLELVKFLINK